MDIWTLDIQNGGIECCVAMDGTIYNKGTGQKMKYVECNIVYGDAIDKKSTSDKLIRLPKTSIFNGEIIYQFKIQHNILKITESYTNYSLNYNDDEYLNVNTLSIYEDIGCLKTTYVNLLRISAIEFHNAHDCNEILVNNKLYSNITNATFDKLKREYEAYIFNT